MRDSIRQTIRPYLSKGVIVDTNILLLLVVGSFQPRLIPNFKRTDKFTIEDFALLIDFLNPFHRLATTPAILAEVNSLSNQLPEKIKPSYYQVFALQIDSLFEIYIPSADLTTERSYAKFGLTDAGIVQAARSGFLVLTDDRPLSGLLEAEGLDVINFNHLRLYGN